MKIHSLSAGGGSFPTFPEYSNRAGAMLPSLASLGLNGYEELKRGRVQVFKTVPSRTCTQHIS